MHSECAPVLVISLETGESPWPGIVREPFSRCFVSSSLWHRLLVRARLPPSLFLSLSVSFRLRWFHGLDSLYGGANPLSLPPGHPPSLFLPLLLLFEPERLQVSAICAVDLCVIPSPSITALTVSGPLFRPLRF